jgi:hypothetical protein
MMGQLKTNFNMSAIPWRSSVRGESALFSSKSGSKLLFMSTNILDTAKGLPLSERIELVEAALGKHHSGGLQTELTAAQAEEFRSPTRSARDTSN